MAVTRSTAADRPRIGRARKLWRRNELLGIVGAGIVVAFGLHLVYLAKSAGFPRDARAAQAHR